MRFFPSAPRRRVMVAASVACAVSLGAVAIPALADDDLKDKKRRVEQQIDHAHDDLEHSSKAVRQASADARQRPGPAARRPPRAGRRTRQAGRCPGDRRADADRADRRAARADPGDRRAGRRGVRRRPPTGRGEGHGHPLLHGGRPAGAGDRVVHRCQVALGPDATDGDREGRGRPPDVGVRRPRRGGGPARRPAGQGGGRQGQGGRPAPRGRRPPGGGAGALRGLPGRQAGGRPARGREPGRPAARDEGAAGATGPRWSGSRPARRGSARRSWPRRPPPAAATTTERPAGCWPLRSTARSPRRSATAGTPSTATGACTTAPTSAPAAAARCSPAPPEP